MCMWVSWSAKEHTAKEDITVYKTLDSGNISSVMGFRYKVNTLYRLRKKLKKERCTISEGFHSFVNQPVGDINVVRMIIPKGAKYYKGRNVTRNGSEGYVSSSIRTGDLKRINP